MEAEKLEQDQAQLKKEATDLFRSVLADERAPQRCEINAAWDTYPIPEEVARQYLKLKLHAQLSSPFSATSVEDIIHPSETEVICSEDSATKLNVERENAFAVSNDKNLYTLGTTYSFPVFNDSYDTAILVITHTERFSYHPSVGTIKTAPMEAVGYAAIYTKSEDGVWRRIRTVDLFVT